MVNRRLLSFLEDNNVLSQTQTGYRKHRSTEDQLALIAQDIENAFQEKKKVVAIFFDLTKAFDKVWREGLQLKVLQSRISGRMYKWIRCFLQDRSARVKVDGYMSESVKMREGVPQGGVISPTLFVLYINITTILSRHVSNTTCRWSCCMECSGPHYMCSLQDSRSCHKNTTVDRWVGSPDQQNSDSFLSSNSQGKDHSEAWRQNTTPSRNTNFSRHKTGPTSVMETTNRWKGNKRNQEISPAEKPSRNTLGS